MIIAISGAQGVGKSTLLYELSRLDYTVDRFSVSRTVQKKLGHNELYDALSNFETMKNFQEEVLHAKFEHDFALKTQCSDNVFVERSFYDILAYSELWTKRFPSSKPQIENWLSGFKTCAFLNQQIYSGVILIETNDKVAFEYDKNRGDFETQQAHNDRLKELCLLGSIPHIIITESALDARVREASKFAESLK
jgi:predicted ATPase